MTPECGSSCRGQWGNRSGNARGCRYCYTADRVRGFVLSLATVDFGSNNPVVTSPYVLVSSRECRKKGVKADATVDEFTERSGMRSAPGPVLILTYPSEIRATYRVATAGIGSRNI